MVENQEVAKESIPVLVAGKPLTAWPRDLYIPPDALQVFLETFEGPLDLLLYLIKKQDINILDIPIAEITRQYMEYVELIREARIELAAEYLVMAATLAEIKSRLLLPQWIGEEEGIEVDPRAELVRRLQEYERYKKAALALDELPRVDRDTFVGSVIALPIENTVVQPDVALPDLLQAIKAVLERAHLYQAHRILHEPLSIRERMSMILSAVKADRFVMFTTLFTETEGRMGVVVTLIALLELIRQSAIEWVQVKPYAPIYLRAKEGQGNE